VRSKIKFCMLLNQKIMVSKIEFLSVIVYFPNLTTYGTNWMSFRACDILQIGVVINYSSIFPDKSSNINLDSSSSNLRMLRA
jgi:predicted small integral membrane protein